MAFSPSEVMQAYSPPLSLWNLVEQHVPAFELEEVKSILGSNLVDQSLELHREIEMFLDIWRDMRDEVQENKLVQSRLPEPPNQRERLVQEINFFAENIKDKAKRKGIDPDDILKTHNNSIIDYASDVSRPGSSMGRTSRSSDGRETPMMVASPDRILRSYEVTDEIEAVSGKLNVHRFDDVCAHLRLTLEKEVDQLLADIEFLQNCLDNQANIRDSIDTPHISREPTLTELREERTSLERELLLTDNLTYTPQVDKPLFNDGLKKPLLANPMRTTTKPTRTSNQIPVKATHLISSSPTNIEKQITPPTSYRNSSKSAYDHHLPLRAVHDVPLTKPPLETNKDNRLSSLRSKAFSRESTTTAFLPTPPKASIPERISRPNLSKTSSQEPPQCDVLTTNGSQIPEGASVSKIHRGRRTLSPGRVRVVNLNSIVGTHAGKTDTVTSVGDDLEDLNTSDPLLPFNSVPSNTANPNVGQGLRPRSADRFRKMVMGCRDGE